MFEFELVSLGFLAAGFIRTENTPGVTERAKEAAMEAGGDRFDKVAGRLRNFVSMILGTPEAARIVGQESMDKANEKMTEINEGISSRWNTAKEKFNRGKETVKAGFEKAAASTLEWTAAPIQRRAEQISNIGAWRDERGAGKLEKSAVRLDAQAEESNFVSQPDAEIASMEDQIAALQEKIRARKDQLEENMLSLMDQRDDDNAGAASLRQAAEGKRQHNAQRFGGARRMIEALRTSAADRIAA